MLLQSEGQGFRETIQNETLHLAIGLLYSGVQNRDHDFIRNFLDFWVF